MCDRQAKRAASRAGAALARSPPAWCHPSASQLHGGHVDSHNMLAAGLGRAVQVGAGWTDVSASGASLVCLSSHAAAVALPARMGEHA